MTTAPMNPLAGASGPGPYAVRSDKLSMGSTSYGEGGDTQAILSGSTLSDTPGVTGEAPSTFRRNVERGNATADTAGTTQEKLTGLFDNSKRPGEPVMHGVDIGDGAGSSALSMQSNVPTEYTDAYQLFNSLAANPNSSPTMKYLAQRIQQGF